MTEPTYAEIDREREAARETVRRARATARCAARLRAEGREVVLEIDLAEEIDDLRHALEVTS